MPLGFDLKTGEMVYIMSPEELAAEAVNSIVAEEAAPAPKKGKKVVEEAPAPDAEP